MKTAIWLTLLLTLAGCITNSIVADKWQRYSIDISGRRVSFSSPPGSFRGKHVPSIDLATNQESYVTLFESSWIFSGLTGDAGALELIVGLNRAPVGSSDDDLLRGIEENVAKTYSRIARRPVTLERIGRRQIGGKQWLCYDRSVYGRECALRIDAEHYLSWRLHDINNRSTQIDARDELRQKIEGSVEVAF